MPNLLVRISCLVILVSWVKFKTYSFLTLILGVILCIVGYVVISIIFTNTDQSKRKVINSKFKFTKRDSWESELKQFDQDGDQLEVGLLTSSNSDKLISLFDLIINEFISSWYDHISSSTLFKDDIKIELVHITTQIVSRLKKLDFANLLVTKLLPIFNEHFLEFSRMKKFINASGTLSEEHDELLTFFNGGSLHMGVTTKKTDMADRNFNEKKYFRKQVEKLLSVTLSEKEQSCEISRIFVTEILACTILDNVFNLLSESDFYNLMIVKVIGDNLRRRDQVKELRAALAQHTLSGEHDLTTLDKLDGILDDELQENVMIGERAGLESILTSASKTKEYYDFLLSIDKAYLLEFWQTVERIKSPLDDITINTEDSDAIGIIKQRYFDTKLIDVNQEELQLLMDVKSGKSILYKIQNRVFDELVLNNPQFMSSKFNETKRHSQDDVLASIENTFFDIMNNNTNKQDATDFDEKENSDRYSKLFQDETFDESDDDEEEETSDTDESFIEKGSESVEFAAPGNLNLAEEIPKVEQEIESLKQQLSYLEPLLNKAELTNHSSKYKVLHKSKIGVQKDLQLKELQLQQYIIQENDNSLFGKSRVNIESLVNGNENGKEFVLYIIEVQKFSSENPDIIKAGWVVARRYSQFHRLNGYLKRRYPQVSNLNFPRKSISVLKFQQKNIIDNRRYLLEVYLKNLVNIPEVCADKAFRSFLSSENFHLRKFHHKFDENQPKRLSGFFSKNWYLGLSSKAVVKPQTNEELLENKRIMEKELRQFDEKNNSNSNSSSSVSLSNTTPTKQSFVKPICDIIITVFNLHWLKGRALVVILQQVFGTAIENKVYEFISTQTNPLKIDEILLLITNLLFPNGKFKDPPEIRTTSQKSKTANEAKILFHRYMNENFTKLFGTNNTDFASNILFKMIQVDQLNKHLLFRVFDQLVDEICK
ncbi:uncharacterized protein KGF55_000240 [Candida pseudojiufengensis]|uniref:uncharacterized protein n=1 Tax=Candida pseudojiufengensis TaxID=497109 RepID=UPI002224E85E|nr:uncharacterized protein KGF55_000240 [Candida pseudojiufengensis]KAI5966831.1 hypothetical protein KGF55_000240 [Candida pseudojiufengensis]